MNWLWFSLIIVVCYFIGNINFSRIVARFIKHEDITTKGSGNPGFTNMLRNYGIWIAMLTFLLEAVKVAIPTLICGYLFAPQGLFEVAYFTAGLAIVLGNDFPVFYKFKGGKGIACEIAVFLFSPLWYVALVMCLVYVAVVYCVDYGVIGSFVFISVCSVAWLVRLCVLTPRLWWVVIIIVLIMLALCFIMNRTNIVRLMKGTENHTGFRDKLNNLFKKKQKVEKVAESPEKEIVVDDNTEQNKEERTE